MEFDVLGCDEGRGTEMKTHSYRIKNILKSEMMFIYVHQNESEHVVDASYYPWLFLLPSISQQQKGTYRKLAKKPFYQGDENTYPS